MGKYILQKQDYEDISYLINISKSIKDIYMELKEIEINLGKDSFEYIKCLERLKSLLSLENNIYKRITNNFYKCEAIVNYLIDSKQYKTTNNCYDLLLDKMYNLEISRIIIKLNKYIIEKSHDLISKLEIEDENVKNQLFKDSNYAFYISSILHLDTLRCFLAILKQDNLNELSTYMKYKISCLFSEMEEEFLDNNFEIDTNPYISAQLYTDLFSEKETLKEIRTSQFLENSYIQIDHFLKYSDCDLEDSKIKDDLIMRMCFLRSLLIFLDNDKSNETLYQLNQFIMSETGYYKTKKILNLFGESFRHQKEDIKIPKILTLRKI